MRARTLRFFLNLWPPFVGAGIHVTLLAEDYREAIVELRPHWYNRNLFGDHFGGSLYAMTDAFFALMLIHILGPGYRVTHAAGNISYLAPARGVVRARFHITDELIAAIKAAAESGEKHLPQFSVEILDSDGEVVARATHTAYVRKKADR
jgi:acyl-coenzyme A thioesterase PaaI-like protein